MPQVPKSIADLIRTDAPASGARAALGLGDAATHAATDFLSPSGDASGLQAARPGLARVLAKLASGQPIKIDYVGDSYLEGLTASVPGTTDCASLICSTLATRYGVTVTKSNRAKSGYTTAFALSIIQSGLGEAKPRFYLALDDAADLYVLSFGHNDIRSDQVSPGTGYPQAASIGALEHMIRRIRTDLPWADILLLTEGPYNTASNASNTQLLAYNQSMRRLAAAYGCEYADGYAAYLALGNYQGYIDGTNHPNDAGHALWASSVLARFPAAVSANLYAAGLRRDPPATSLYGAHRYTRSAWAYVPTTAGVGAGTPAFRTTGTWTGTAPYTSSTAGDKVSVVALGSEVLLNLDCGPGTGTVKINVANTTVATVDLTTYPAGQASLPITGLSLGVNSLEVYVVSGTVSWRGFYVLTGPSEWFDPTSTRVTQVGTWTNSTNSTTWNNVTSTTTTTGDSISWEFVGTGTGLNMLRYYQPVGTPRSLTVSVDGAAGVTVESKGTDSAVSSAPGALDLVSGLEFGRHTITVTRPANGPNSFQIYSIYSFDESRLQRPRRQLGIAKVGEAVKFGVPFAGKPMVRCYAAKGSTTPLYPSAETIAGFTVGGTASDTALWEAEGSSPVAF